MSLLPWTQECNAFGNLLPYCGRVMSVSGGLLEIVGECRVMLNFPNFSVYHSFLFCRGLSVGISAILGVDFLTSVAAVLDFANSRLLSKFGSVTLDSQAVTATLINDPAHVRDCEPSFHTLIEEFSDIMRSDGDFVGETALIEHDIVLEDDHPIHVRPRPIPFHLREIVAEQLEKMLKLNIIRVSSSPWSSPILLVPKADGKYRFCVDFRRLNERTRKDRTPMPRIDDVFAEIGDARVFTTLDLLSGFWQVPLTSRAQEYTAFSVGNRHFEFVKTPFGLTGAPATFARLMQKVLGEMTNTVVFGDDVLIFSSSEEQHVDHVRAVLQRLRQAGLVLNTKKCHFGQREVQFLGHRIAAGSIAPQMEKVECIREFPCPKSKKQLQSFIGLSGFYRRYIPNFSSIMVPLYELLKGDAPWKWGQEENEAFETIKRKLCDQPVVLNLPDITRSFEVTTDASNVGLGAVLSQDGRVVEYASRKLSKAERNYSTTERELLAVVWALEKWRQYLFAQSSVVFTDHRPITFLKTLKEPKGRIARWIVRLQEYDFTLKYKPGSENYVADFLSRLPECLEAEGLADHETLPPAAEVVASLLFTEDPRGLYEEQRQDPDIKAVIEAIEGGAALDAHTGVQKRYRQIQQQLSLSKDGLLLRSLTHRSIPVKVPVIPPCRRRAILEECHSSAHMGVARTYDLARCNAYWPGLQTDVQKFVTSCARCQLGKPGTNLNKAPLQPIFTARPMEVWALDILGPLPITSSGARYILVATDLFSKWVEAVPLINQTAASVAQAFVQNVVLRHGSPESLLTDQGTNFESLLMKEVCRLLGIKKLRTSPFHPRTDGQTERANRTIKGWLASAGGEWEKQLPFMVYFLNSTVNASTKVSPFQLLFGRHPSLFQSSWNRHGVRAYDGSSSDYAVFLQSTIERFLEMARDNAEISKREFAERYNAVNCPRRWKPFSVGDPVRYKNHYPDPLNRKFSARYRGPFKVIECRGVNYKIEDERGKPKWVHHDDLLRWRDREYLPAVNSQGAGPVSQGSQGQDVESDGVSDVISSSSSSSCDETDEELDDDLGEGVRLRRSTRIRRPPVWLRDFYT